MQLLLLNQTVVGLDNFATGHKHNITEFLQHKNFKLIEGDIRNLEQCKNAVIGVDYVLHQAALGSVPRSIEDPISSNSVNVDGFLNILVAKYSWCAIDCAIGFLFSQSLSVT